MSEAGSEPALNSGLTESAAWRVTARGIILVLGLLAMVWLAAHLHSVIVRVILAVILSAAMTPLVDYLTRDRPTGHGRWRPSRGLVVVVLYLLLLLSLVSVIALVMRPLTRELEDLARHAPDLLDNLQELLHKLPQTYPFIPDTDLNSALAEQIQLTSSQISGLLPQALIVARFAAGIVGGLFDLFFVFVLALYITADSRGILGYLVSFFPVERREQAERVASHIGIRLGGWVRGQFLLCVIIGTMTLAGLSIIGVRYAVLLAIIAAIGEAIPMIGPIITAVPAVLIAFTQSPSLGLMTLGLFVLVQQLENHLIVPRVMSRAVSLHPLAVLLALLAGGQLMGIAGAILAVPVTAALSVLVAEIQRERAAHPALQGSSSPAPA